MLKDVLTYDLDVVFCGTAKGKKSADSGFYYAHAGNKFYKILFDAGFTPHRLVPETCYQINQHKIGLTDLVHKQSGNDRQINKSSYEVDLFSKKMIEFQPKFIAFTSKTAASFALGFNGKTRHINYGLADKVIGKSKIFILPSTSGAAARFWAPEYWRDLRKMI
ncbi:MAG: mismatch-specific DNA-glycosylase [Bacteroidetes bacterium]|jgi:TDG/mug DNA glycosylase family protein|nr:MAG: mismatch-specific DNA-glycosylase [Bacteroidota bacterium]